MTASPILQRLPIDVLTTLGWLNGTLHLPGHLPLEEYLALGQQDLKLTGVAIPREPERLRFLALRRESVVVVVPPPANEPDHAAASAAFTTTREVACLLPDGMLKGTLRLFSGLRLSDHLQLQGRLVTLRDCLLTPYGATAQSEHARVLPTALVYLQHAIGFSES
ncbi:MAG TPA: hypothetical protein VFN08_12185 [Gemmatimonadales bacterium]|jgi:hypothetical protein|nr:hypothetical protein [Gemmatimonadales bacterium]